MTKQSDREKKGATSPDILRQAQDKYRDRNNVWVFAYNNSGIPVAAGKLNPMIAAGMVNYFTFNQ